MSFERRVPALSDSPTLAAPVTAKSAAWLLAEGMFAAPPQLPASAAIVTIRRSRLAAPTPESPALAQGDAPNTAPPDAEPHAPSGHAPSNASSSAPNNGPRVFRIDALKDEPQAGPVEAPPAEPDSFATMAVPRRQRISSDKRPGPVLRIVPDAVEPVEAPAVEPVAVVAAQATPPREQVAALSEMLARVDRILADIRNARSLRFVDDRFADTWQGLSQRARQLQEQLA